MAGGFFAGADDETMEPIDHGCRQAVLGFRGDQRDGREDKRSAHLVIFSALNEKVYKVM